MESVGPPCRHLNGLTSCFCVQDRDLKCTYEDKCFGSERLGQVPRRYRGLTYWDYFNKGFVVNG